MTGRRLRPPEGGDKAPKVSSPLDGGESLDLVALATAICERYRLEYPDERERYGDAGNAWCVGSDAAALAAHQAGSSPDLVVRHITAAETPGWVMILSTTVPGSSVVL